MGKTDAPPDAFCIFVTRAFAQRESIVGIGIYLQEQRLNPSYTVVRIDELQMEGHGTDFIPLKTWDHIPTLRLDHFRPEGSEHRPLMSAQFCHSTRFFHGRFLVKDRFVQCVATHYQDPVCKDSCVELFVLPRVGCGYITFEFSANGTLLCYHIRDWQRTPQGFASFDKVPAQLGQTVQVRGSLLGLNVQESAGSLDWWLECAIPHELIAAFTGAAVPPPAGTLWGANVYKCADASSHPHWASWSPVDALNFHLPHCFGSFVFA